MAPLAIIGSVVSGVMGAIGAMQQANATANAADQNARIAEYNRSVAKRNASATLAATAQDMQDKQRQNARNLSSIRAAYGASGLALAGSPLDVLEDTALEQQLDVSKVGYKGELKAIGYKDEANNFAMKAELSRMEADSARAAGPISAIGNIFGSASKIGSTLMAA
jgi:hypothetical protein